MSLRPLALVIFLFFGGLMPAVCFVQGTEFYSVRPDIPQIPAQSHDLPHIGRNIKMLTFR